MHFERNPQLEKELYDRLREKYSKPREGIHLSGLNQCLTKTWYDSDEHSRLEPTEKEMLFFAIGFGLEAVLLRDDPPNATEPPEPEQLDGVWMSLDYIALDSGGVDLKSTRMYSDENSGAPKRGWPESWMRQFMAYAKLLGHTQFSVAVLYLGQPNLVGGTFIFDTDEIEDNWLWIVSRRERYEDFQAIGKPPTPFKFNESWECQNCRYLMRCQSSAYITDAEAFETGDSKYERDGPDSS